MRRVVAMMATGLATAPAETADAQSQGAPDATLALVGGYFPDHNFPRQPQSNRN